MHKHSKVVSDEGEDSGSSAYSAFARKQMQITMARHELETAVITFLDEMKSGGEERLGRNPYSADLLSFFQKYAETCLSAEMKKVLPVASIVYGRQLLKEASVRIVRDICKKDGVWTSVVIRACIAVDMGGWETRFGTYERKDFMHPKRLQLMAHLSVYWRKLEAEMWRNSATEQEADDSQAKGRINKGSSSHSRMEFPNRARWLKGQLAQLKWSVAEFSTIHRGPDPKTIRKLLRGERVTDSTLDRVVAALSAKNSKITIDSIPKD